jgi:hypothetical protein
MVEIDPKAAMKFEDRQRPIHGLDLLCLAGWRHGRHENGEAGSKQPTQEGESHSAVEKS